MAEKRTTLRQNQRANPTALKLRYWLWLLWAIGLGGYGQQTIVDYRVPRTYVLGGYRIEGAEGIDLQLLHAIIALDRGEKIQIPGEELKQAMERLWKHGLFQDVQVEIDRLRGDSVWLVFKVRRQPLVRHIAIEGVSRSMADDIAERIKAFKGKAYTDAVKRGIEASVRSFLRYKGFLKSQVQVQVAQWDTARQTVDLEVIIHKGPKSRIDRIIFYGNRRFSDYRLKRVLKNTKEHARFWFLRRPSLKELVCGRPDTCPIAPTAVFNPKHWLHTTWAYLRRRVNPNIFVTSAYHEEDWMKDKWALLGFYHSKGYRNAQILKDTVVFTADADLIIKVWLKEGRQYYFRDIQFVGNTLYSDSVLRERLGIHKGDVYNRQLLEQRLYGDPAGRDIASLYMNQGYMFFNATPVEKRVENDSVDIEIRIYEGPKAYVDRVKISGNTKTHDHVIRRELYTDPGDVFSRDDVVRSQRQLAALGYFDPENMKINPQPDPKKGTVDIEYGLSERPSDQVELSMGFGGGMIVGSLGLILNNFSLRELVEGGHWDPIPSGDGQRLTIRAQSNYSYYRALTFSFTDPWFGGRRPHSFTLAAYVNQYTNGKKRTEPGFSEQLTWGGTISWGFRLRWPDDYFSLFTSLEYQRIRLTNSTFFGSLFTDGSTNNLYTEIKLVRNSVDQPIYPRTGAELALTGRFTPPYYLIAGAKINDPQSTDVEKKFRWLEYYKLKFDANWYTPLTPNRKLVLKARYSIGYLGFYNRLFTDMPFERFELGGDGLSNFAFYGKEIISLRGYDPFVTNGRVFEKISLELRYPVTLSPMSTIYVLGFVDLANAWVRPEDVNLLQLRRAAGIGVRFILPMVGLMGFDFGIGFDKPGIGPQPPNQWFRYLQAPYTRINIVLGFEPY